MYNRYIRNDNGSYSRIPQEDHPPKTSKQPNRTNPSSEKARFQPSSLPKTAGRISDSLTGSFRHLLDLLHLEHVDTGDLLLLLLLFVLFREDADEELLAALGLLLIL